MNGRDAPAALSGEGIPVFIECEIWSAAELVWMVLEGKKKSHLPGLKPWSVQPVATRCTDCAVILADRVNVYVRF